MLTAENARRRRTCLARKPRVCVRCSRWRAAIGRPHSVAAKCLAPGPAFQSARSATAGPPRGSLGQSTPAGKASLESRRHFFCWFLSPDHGLSPHVIEAPIARADPSTLRLRNVAS
ncbi:hypothetical protein MTO96_049692 [Rhipicephalus appendiculatus]